MRFLFSQSVKFSLALGDYLSKWFYICKSTFIMKEENGFIRKRDGEIMKTLIVYTSATGFTKRYGEWIAERVEGDLIPLEEAKKKEERFFLPYDTIVYGGWAIGGKIHKSRWFLDRLEQWKDKKLAIFCVGASPAEGNDEIKKAMNNILSEEEKKLAKLFYFPGGLNYEKMPFFYRLSMRAFAKAIKKKEPEKKEMHKMLSSSYDISDPKMIDSLIDYITQEVDR